MLHPVVLGLPLAAALTLFADFFGGLRGAVLVSSAAVQGALVVALVAMNACRGAIGGHWLPALALYRGAATSLLGDGLPVAVHWPFAAIGSIMFSGIVMGEVWTAGVTHFYNWIHILIYALGGVLCASSAFVRPTGRLVRRAMDPLCLCALGSLFIGHVHDPSQVAVLYHTYLGWLLVALAAAIFLCALVHDVLPRHHAACEAMRLLAATAYLLPGVWLQQMAIMLYSSVSPASGHPPEGLHHLLEARGIKAKTPTEAALTHLALAFLVSALALPLLVLATRQRAARATGTRGAERQASATKGSAEEDAIEQGLPLVAAGDEGDR